MIFKHLSWYLRDPYVAFCLRNCGNLAKSVIGFPGTKLVKGIVACMIIYLPCASQNLPAGFVPGSIRIDQSRVPTCGNDNRMVVKDTFLVDYETGLNQTTLAGYDYCVKAYYGVNGFTVASQTIGEPGSGLQPGLNNDHYFSCNTCFSKSSGDLHNVNTWGENATPIDISKISQVQFRANSDVASSKANRFSVTVKAVSDIVSSKTGISTYPNPIMGKTIQMAFANQPAGVYKIQLFNAAGQAVYSTTINYSGGTGTQKLQLYRKPVPGIYLLQVGNGKLKESMQVLIK